jgi:hypothetical protein
MFFSELKAEIKSKTTEWSFTNFLSSYIVGMFEYEGVPVDNYGLCLMEQLMLLTGKAAIFWNDKFKRWTAGKVSFTGTFLNEYGLLEDCECFDKAGHEFTFKDWANNEKCFVFFNDRSHNPDINILRYADLMAKIDISLNANIVNSRMSPIVVCKDANTANQVREVLKKNHDGATEVITSSNILSDDEDIKVINITDVNASDKIQYLSHAHDDLLRRFLNIYGLHISGTGKMAQQSIEEINGTNNVALVVPYEMLKSRKDTLERFAAVTGIECDIKLSKAWEREDKEADAQTDTLTAEADEAEATADTAEAEADIAEVQAEAAEDGELEKPGADIQPTDESAEQEGEVKEEEEKKEDE